MKFERAPDKEIFSFWQGVLQIADNIRAGKFAPTPGENQCRWCDYRNLCPVFTGKEYSAVNSSSKELPPLAQKNPQEELSQKIDRLGELKEQVQKLEQEIISCMKQNNFQRHFGSAYKAELNTAEKIELTDNNQVVELLSKLGLLSKVLVPTKTTVARLLTDEAVSAKDKEKLRALVQRVQEVQLALEKIAQLP